MSYTSLQALTERFGLAPLVDLTDRAEPPRRVVDQTVIARALADTDAVIDGYLAGRYVLPLAVVPPLLASLAGDIAFYKLHVTQPNEKVAADYRAAIAELGKIATGTVRLPAAGIEPASGAAGGVVFTDRVRPITAENSTGFI